jgi:hypothetical protein
MYTTLEKGVQGWFLRLCFGYHLPNKKVCLDDIGLSAISVPVILNDLVNNKKSLCYVVGGFHGIHSSEDGKHKPVMSLSVFEEVTPSKTNKSGDQ